MIPQKLAYFIEKYFWNIVFIALVWFFAKESFGNAKDFFYWKDDWVFLWSNKYNPEAFYNETAGGKFWFIKTGLLVDPYIRLYGVINRELFQLIGLFLKFTNSILLYFLVYVMTGSKKQGIFAAFLLASFGGAFEIYTWHRETALTVSFVLLGFIYYFKYLKTKKRIHLVLLISSFFISLLIYPGRIIGFVPLLILSSGMLFFKEKKKQIVQKRTFIYLAVFSLIILLVGNIVQTSISHTSLNEIFLTSLKNGDVFFSSVGNLLRTPFVKYWELAGLTAPGDPLSLVLGYGLFIIGLLAAFMYLKVGKRSLFFFAFSVLLIYLMYLPNWLFGGGNTTTSVGSTHRYLAVSAVGIPMVLSLFLVKVKIPYAYILLAIMITLNLNYSKYVRDIEGAIRNTSIVEPIYKEVVHKVSDPKKVRLLVLNAPNNLKSYVVLGWFPYAFAYYTGLSSYGEFPTVFPDWGTALQWVCAQPEERIKIQQYMGVVDYKNTQEFYTDDIYGWFIKENGEFTDKTDSLREYAQNCGIKKRI